MTFSTFILKGGPVMLVLLGFSILTVALILAKIFQFVRSDIQRSNFVLPVLEKISADDSAGAFQILSQERSPLARVMEVTLNGLVKESVRQKEVEADVMRVGSAEIRNLESYLRTLGVTAHLCPLLGLLGTVLGMITAFQKLEGIGMRVNPGVLAGGIWEALLTTAFGLIVAIPAMAAYHYFEGEVDNLSARMKDTVTQMFLRYAQSQRNERRPNMQSSTALRANLN